MLSARRAAQIGLVGACLLLTICLSILIAGAADEPRQLGSDVSLARDAHVVPLGAAELLSVSSK
jgi:hypothetical protein